MNTKLTISLDSEIIHKAKVFAGKKKTSLSKLIENYFRELTEKQREETPVLVTDHELLKISGSIELPESIDTKEVLAEQLIKKYVHD